MLSKNLVGGGTGVHPSQADDRTTVSTKHAGIRLTVEEFVIVMMVYWRHSPESLNANHCFELRSYDRHGQPERSCQRFGKKRVPKTEGKEQMLVFLSELLGVSWPSLRSPFCPSAGVGEAAPRSSAMLSSRSTTRWTIKTRAKRCFSPRCCYHERPTSHNSNRP